MSHHSVVLPLCLLQMCVLWMTIQKTVLGDTRFCAKLSYIILRGFQYMGEGRFELFMVFTSVCMSSYQGWKWVCWKLAKVQYLLSAYRTLWIKANQSRQLSPPFMLINLPQLWLRPSPVKGDGSDPFSGPFRHSVSDVGQQDHLFPDTNFCWKKVAALSCPSAGRLWHLNGPYCHNRDCSIKMGLNLSLALVIFIIQQSKYWLLYHIIILLQ